MSLPVVSESIDSYLAEVSRFPLLSASEEMSLARRYYRERCIDDAHRLVTSNLRYVVRIAMEYRSYGCRMADLIQEGNIGLMVAVKKFNPFKGFRLITYATWWIRSHMQEFIMKSRTLVRRGTKALKKKLFYRKDVFGADGAISNDADRAAEEYAKRAESADAFPTYDLSLNTAIGDDSTTHQDLLADDGPGQEEVVSLGEETAIVRRGVTEALAVLSSRERMVIENRVMAEEPESLQGLGDRLGVTRERVRQIEKQAMGKLARELADRGLEEAFSGA